MTIERLLGVVTDRFVAVSTSEKEQILSSGIRTTDIDVVWPSINCDYWKPIQRASARESLGIGRDRRVVVGIGRLSHQKDPSTFVRVIGELRARYPDVCGVWVGGGELREQLSDEVTSLDLTANVTVTGWQTDVRPYIASSDLLLSTARYESFGYVVPEALAMERTVVGTDITGTRDILPAVDPILSFQAGDYESASRIILELLDAPARLERIGKAGSRFVKAHFDVDRMSSRISLLYDVSNRGGQKEIVADRV
jgi:glycosyltransferase involved in cell wall biosynthesis